MTRSLSGELCVVSGTYVFDGYLDDGPSTRAGDPRIDLHRDEIFPTAPESARLCYWKLRQADGPSRGTEPQTPRQAD